MTREIEISVQNRVAWQTNSVDYICGNGDFVVNFLFDDEWKEHDSKTARFIHNGEHTDIVFTGNRCSIPKIMGAKRMEIGVFAGNVYTTTPAFVQCRKSILCGSGLPADPPPDVYAQIMEQLDNGASEEQIARAVEKYLEENPIQSGATAEEAAQIEQNKQDIETLTREKLSADALPGAVNEALAQAKASGEFKGEKGEPGQPGDDYILTEVDKQEIAEMAAELVEVPESGVHAGPEPPEDTSMLWIDTNDNSGEVPEGGNDELFFAVYGETTYAEISDALNAGKMIFVKYQGGLVPYTCTSGNHYFQFINNYGMAVRLALGNDNTWSQHTESYLTSSSLSNYYNKTEVDNLIDTKLGVIENGSY